MKKETVKRIAAILLIVMSLSAVLAACGKDNGGDKDSVKTDSKTTDPGTEDTDTPDRGAKTEKMSLKIAVLTGFTQDGSWNEKRLEEKYNVDIELIVLPGWADAPAKINLLMADEKERPDVVWWWNMNKEFVQWVDAGLLADVSPYMDKYTNIRDYYNKMDDKTLFYATSGDGMYRIPGDVAEPSCEVTWIRKDWLDNLGLEVPKTLDDLSEVIRAFTFDDPDGNGKNDTYGLGGDGYDFRSFWPYIQAFDGGHYDRFMVEEDGSVSYGPANESTKNWVGKVAELYKEGCITPNITTDTNRDEEMAQGGFGVTYSWCAWGNKDTSAPMVSFYASNPDAEWIPIDMVAGENGNPQEDPATSAAWCYFGITNKCSDPERAYAMFDDLVEMTNYKEKKFGIEGEHYTIDNGLYTPIISPESQDNQDKNIGLMLLDNFVNRKDEANIANSPEVNALFDKSGKNSRDIAAKLVEWKDPTRFTSWLENGTDIEDLKNEYLWGVVAGTRSLDEWDSYQEQLKACGLDEVLEQANTLYSEQKAEIEAYFAQ